MCVCVCVCVCVYVQVCELWHQFVHEFRRRLNTGLKYLYIIYSMRGLRLSRNAALLLYTTQVIFFRVVQCTVFFPRYFAFFSFFFSATPHSHQPPMLFFCTICAQRLRRNFTQITSNPHLRTICLEKFSTRLLLFTVSLPKKVQEKNYLLVPYCF